MFYKITLTASGGISSQHCKEIAQAFSGIKFAIVVNEFGDTGRNSHLECVLEFDTTKTSNVTERMRTMYNRLQIPFVRGISVRVKKVTHLAGAIIYATKEIDECGKVLLRNGWAMDWITKQRTENIKSIPFKMLNKKGTRLTQNTAGALMYEFAKSKGMAIRDKAKYREVAVLMGADGYLWGSVRHQGVYQDVCALFGDGAAVGEAIDQALKWFGEDEACKQCGAFRD